jgi:hypothetical protein
MSIKWVIILMYIMVSAWGMMGRICLEYVFLCDSVLLVAWVLNERNGR